MLAKQCSADLISQYELFEILVKEDYFISSIRKSIEKIMHKEDILLDEIDYSDLEAKYAINEDITTNNILVVDHIPQLEDKNASKFVALLKKKLFIDFPQLSIDNFYFPRDENGLYKQ